MFVTYPPHIREKAAALRHDGMTIDEIAERLAPISRTTIYYWVGQIEIPRTTKQTEGQRRATRRMQKQREQEREGAYRAGLCGFHAMVELDASFRDFVSLYIGEGYKRCRNTVSIANSDPVVVELAFRWLTRLSRNPVTCWVQYHADQDLDMLQDFWSGRLGIERNAIKLQRKSNSGRMSGRIWRSRFGVLTVRSRDTLLRARVEGWMDEMKASWLDSPIVGV
jgi:transposase-like protein